MAVDGEEADAGKAQSEVSPETTVFEKTNKEEVVSKEDDKLVGEENGETKKTDEGKINTREKNEISLPLSGGDERGKNKKSENGDCDEKGKNLDESKYGACNASPPSDGNKKKNAINECDERSDENVNESENDEFPSTPIHAKDGELPLTSEENRLIPNLTEFEKKALMELRSKIEEAILSNTLSANKEDEKEQFQKELNSIANEEKSMETNVKIDKGLSLWGVPLLPSKEDERTDTLLFKFLKARDFKPDDALEMLKNTLAWRKENRIDSIVDEDLGNDDGDYDSVAFMEGFDREGHPICYNVYGVFGNEEMYNKAFGDEVRRDKFLRWRMRLLEKEILKLDFRSGGISTLLQVNDLKNTPGPSRRDLRHATKRALGIFQDNYPEFVARNIFINVPFWYYAFNAVLSPFLMQRTKSKFVFSRPSRVTETLLKYITAEEIPVVYGGLRRESDPDFSTQDVALEINIKAGATETIEIPAPEVGNTLIWELTIIGWDVNYKEEFVPTDEGSYTVIVKKGRKISWQQEPIRNSFKNKEPGKVVITIDNTMFKKKRVLYRYKTRNHSVSSSSKEF